VSTAQVIRDSADPNCDSDTGEVIRLAGSVCIEAPAREVWARLARLEDIQLWSEAVVAARCEGALSQGVGAERTCDLVGGFTIKERWLAWEEGRSFSYEGIGIPLIARAKNEWTVEPDGERTLLTSRAEVVLKGGVAGRLLEPIIAYQFKRIGPRARRVQAPRRARRGAARQALAAPQDSLVAAACTGPGADA